MIVMSIDDRVGENLDGGVDYLIMVFNGTNETQSVAVGEGFAGPLVLHPIQASSADLVVRQSAAVDGNLSVPAITTAVFVAEEVSEEAQAEMPAEMPAEENNNLILFVILGVALLVILEIWLLRRPR
jgi:hypothetical protein